MAEPGCETSWEESLGTERQCHYCRLLHCHHHCCCRHHCHLCCYCRCRHCHCCRPCSDGFATYSPRVLKQVHEGLSLSQKALRFTDSFLKDIFERIADEASRLACSTKHSTITLREIQTAVHLLLPGVRGGGGLARGISKHTMSQASKAIIRYTGHHQ
ncbi:unnamed protein product [Nyctereutes procyonoides]|uniref:(raccoon dog) hypothetical protein n=1 Tax=Nyctereutes procyonoides TaxID=34880 RepID=A0A811Z1D6_NYCPR|nr:unnamed protein product [Nyctereutes procyonoides]